MLHEFYIPKIGDMFVGKNSSLLKVVWIVLKIKESNVTAIMFAPHASIGTIYKFTSLDIFDINNWSCFENVDR
jgi:hypothetical protein